MGWDGARALMEDARDASCELHRHDVKYDAMEARALALGGGIGTSSRGPAQDRMRAVDAYVDYEAMMGPKVAAWCETVDAAVAVLYGRDLRAGIAVGLGIKYAEVLDLIYIQRLSHLETARRMKVGTTTVNRLRNRALAYIDAVGFEAAIAGE